MATVFLSIGSNIDRERHMIAGLQALQKHFGELRCSRFYESEAVNFKGNHFLNVVVAVTTDLSVGELSILLKTIEDDNGRHRDESKSSGNTLDIDILTYDSCTGVIDGVELPRAEITDNAFVLLPLSEIGGGQLHPPSQKTYAELWQDYDKAKQRLWPVDFTWQNPQAQAV